MRTSLDKRQSGLRYVVCVAACGLLAFVATGCSRALYRTRADRQVYGLVHQAASDPRWPLEGYTIEPDPASRFFDPTSPDCPPMPPDDPVSHNLMRRVDKKRGWPFWPCYGKTPFVENPAWMACLPWKENGTVVLDRQGAVRLSLLHSREYQYELEQLYLAALEVTAQRFRFDCQYYGGSTSGQSNPMNPTSCTADGPARAGGGGVASSVLAVGNSVHMQRMMATGTELVVGVANSLVWQFAGPDEYSGMTLLDFSLVQPLLRAGGRAVVMEELTDTERALLANIRQMERFRRGFYARIIAGRSPGPGPTSGSLTVQGLEPSWPGGPGGFLGLLAEQLRINNRRSNVVALRDSLEQLDAFYEAGRIDRYQVDLARDALYNSQSGLLTSKAEYQTRLDEYKMTLGLPPDLEVRIEDPLLKYFNLIDPKFMKVQDEVTMLLEHLRVPAEGADANALVSVLDKLAPVRQNCETQVDLIRLDLERLDEALPVRREHLRRLSLRNEFQQGDADPAVCNTEAMDQRVKELNRDLGLICQYLKITLDDVEQFRHGDVPAGDDEAEAARQRLVGLITDLSSELLELSLVQARTRLETATLVPVGLDAVEALEIARENRRDWMNARAALIDQWRQIEVTANDLRSVLDLTFSGDLSTVGDNPIRFRGTTGRLRVGLQFDAPLTRLLERNAYREALIQYERNRRWYYAFRDEINRSLRRTIRLIRLDKMNFELYRAAARVAISRVDITRLRLLEPPKPGAKSTFGATTARDLVTALAGLLNAQNQFLDVWVGYEVRRRNLDFDMGTMQLDSHGMWIDPGPIESSRGGAAEQAEGTDKVDELPLPAFEEIPPPEGEPVD